MSVTQEPGADAEPGTEIEMRSPNEKHSAGRRGKATVRGREIWEGFRWMNRSASGTEWGMASECGHISVLTLGGLHTTSTHPSLPRVKAAFSSPS